MGETCCTNDGDHPQQGDLVDAAACRMKRLHSETLLSSPKPEATRPAPRNPSPNSSGHNEDPTLGPSAGSQEQNDKQQTKLSDSAQRGIVDDQDRTSPKESGPASDTGSGKGSAKDGSAKDGSTKDGSTKDGSSKDGSSKDGSDGARTSSAEEAGGPGPKTSGDEFSNNERTGKKPSDSSEEDQAGSDSPPDSLNQQQRERIAMPAPEVHNRQQQLIGASVFDQDIKYSDVRLVGRLGTMDVDWLTFHSVLVKMFTPASVSAPSGKQGPPSGSMYATQCIPVKTQEDQPKEQEVWADRHAGAKNSDGYKWRKYGQKLLTLSRLHREYLRCTHPGCPARKRIEVVPETREVVLTTSSEHNHPPVLPIFPHGNHVSSAVSSKRLKGNAGKKIV